MMNDKAKMFLIRAMTEGLECNFTDTASIDYYIEKLREIISNNDKIKSSVIGDYDGLIMEDPWNGPYAIINFSSNLITFGLMVPEPELTDSQSTDFGRIVLACISAVAIIESESKSKNMNMDNQDHVNASNEETVKFNISDIGVII